MFFFRKILGVLFSCNTRFEIRPFALLPTKYHFLVVLMTFIMKGFEESFGTDGLFASHFHSQSFKKIFLKNYFL